MKYQFISIINNRKRIFIVGLILLFLSLPYVHYRISQMEVDGWSYDVEAHKNSNEIDHALKQIFLDKEHFTASSRYEYLFNYFAYGWFKYQSPNGSFIFYPGKVSTRGRTVNGIEGFARFFPLAASWLNSNHSNVIAFNNETFNLVNLLRKGLLNGTNPKHKEYWGDVEDKNQRIVEAADIALALWLSKDKLWGTFETAEKNQIVKWLNQSIDKEIVDNNWNLFPITIVKALEALGYKNKLNLNRVTKLYHDYKKKHYLGEGWFDDPPKGIDYYNAWAIHYSLFWLDQIDPNFDREFIRNSHSEFVEFYKHFFSINGFPIMGRSVCYRLAAPSPVVASALIVPEQISEGFAFRTLDVTWMHFVKNNALQGGKVTQGLYEDDFRLLDNYSGAGSCLWSLRSLVMAFYVDNYIPLIEAKEEPLPVEVTDFAITNKTINWTLTGNKDNNEIILQINNNKRNSKYHLKQYDIIDKTKEFFFKRPFRPNNEDALYKNYKYSNKAQLFIDD